MHDALGRETGYTTVLKIMQIMTEKGLDLRDDAARSHVYRPAIAQERTQRNLAADLLRRAFGGSVRKLMVAALSAERATPEELAEIRKLIGRSGKHDEDCNDHDDEDHDKAKARRAMNAVTSELIERMGWTLAHTVWQGAVAAVVLAGPALPRQALVGDRALRAFVRCPARDRRGRERDVRVASAAHTRIAPRGQRGNARSLAGGFDSSAPIAPSAPRVEPILWSRTILTICVAGWLIGVLAIGVMHAFGWTWLQRCRRRATPASDAWQQRLMTLRARLNLSRRVALFVTDRIDVPIVLGVVRPIILTPIALLNDLPPSQIEAILAHELAHIRRHDYLVNLIQTAIETLLFYHPAVWWIATSDSFRT